jgi:FG-GAP-like repeat/IPT/TIG domain
MTLFAFLGSYLTTKPCRRPAPRFRPILETLERRELMTLSGNMLFPADNPWNEKITNAPVAANSAALVASIGLNSSLHPDFGTVWDGSLNGIPVNIVSGTQPKVNVVIDAYPGESDLLPIPIPANAVIEGDPLPSAQNTGDRHMIVYDQDNNILYETYNTHRPSETTDGQWHADSEAVWNLNTDTFRPPGWTSADAAGLPILPGLVRPDEVLTQGVITHALRFTVPATQNTYVYPASHEAGSNNPNLPPMGERFRLKASFDISHFSAADQVILQALKDYGMIVADNGSPWYLSGEPSSLWDDSDLHNLTQVVGSDFEAVDLTPVVSGLNVSTGLTAGGTSVTISGVNFSGGAGQTQVLFGTTPATSLTVNSDGSITALAPAHAAGTVDVTVQSPYGTSAVTAADRFTFGQSTVHAQGLVGVAPATGQWWVSTSTGASFTAAPWATWSTGVSWVDGQTGDFNGDGKTDIIARIQQSGQWWVGLSNGSSGFTTQLWGTWNPAINWSDVRVGDFNGDGKADLAGFDPATGNWWVSLSTGSSFTSPALWTTWASAVPWVNVFVGDLNGDGKADVIGQEYGQWWANVSSGTSFQPTLWGAWAPPNPGALDWVDVHLADLNGDGRADVIGRYLETGQWWVSLSGKTGFVSTSLWTTWSTAVTWVNVQLGDFNGDGKADLVGQVKESGQWWVGLSTGTSFTNALWATWSTAVTWVDVQVGDFNGDGKDDITGRALQTGQWWTGVASGGAGFATSLWTTWSPALSWVDVRKGAFV